MSDWSQWSPAQLRCLMALSFAVPVHQTHLTQRHGIRSNTRLSLEEAGLIVRDYLYEECRSVGMPFYRLTQAGKAVKRDYEQWQRSVDSQVGELLNRKPVGEPA